VQAELAEAASGTVLWSRDLQGTINEMTDGSSEMLDRLVAETTASIMSNELARAQALPLPTLESYAILMSAINLLNRTSPSNFERARHMLQELTVRTPHHPVPHAWLAAWHVMCLSQGWTSDPAAEARSALDCCKRALDADPNCALALAIDGHAHVFGNRFDIAASRFELALEVNPNESLAWLLKGTMHAFKGEGEMALEAAERALRLSPLDPRRSYYDTHAATAAMSAGYYERAIQLFKRSLRIRQSGNMRREQAAPHRFGGARRSQPIRPTTTATLPTVAAPKASTGGRRCRSTASQLIRGVFIMCTATSGSGCRTAGGTAVRRRTAPPGRQPQTAI
jgi:adenylate cyclase